LPKHFVGHAYILPEKQQICKFSSKKNTATFTIFHNVDFVFKTADDPNAIEKALRARY